MRIDAHPMRIGRCIRMANPNTDTYIQTHTKTNTKCFKDPMYAIFLKGRGFKDFKYDMDMD